MRRTAGRWLYLLILGCLLITPSCTGGGGGDQVGGPVSPAPPAPAPTSLITLTQPSVKERVLGEKRDFYVLGSIASSVTVPGDVRIDLYKSEGATWRKVRSIRSHVDGTGTTPLSAVWQTYPMAIFGNPPNYQVPDLVQDPQGFYATANKVFVAKTWFAGMILGGATKDFDTSYTDDAGQPLEDLTQGTYEVRVTGLSGELRGQVASLGLSFHKSRVLLGRFVGENQDRLKLYAAEKGLRLFLDYFPGYFTLDGNSTKINPRWSANNSLEVANTLPGIVDSNVQDSENHLLVYTVAESNATQSVEIGALVANDLTEAPKMEWLRYDMGEPSERYTDPAGVTKERVGLIVPFAQGQKMAMARYEVKAQADQPQSQENVWYQVDPVRKDVGSDLSVPIPMRTTDRLALFGTCRPIPATAVPGLGGNRWFYTVMKRINRVHYIVRSPGGAIVEDTMRDVALQRYYGTSTTPTPAGIYECKNEFVFNAGAGLYQVEYVGVDSLGAEVSGTRGTLVVSVN